MTQAINQDWLRRKSQIQGSARREGQDATRTGAGRAAQPPEPGPRFIDSLVMK